MHATLASQVVTADRDATGHVGPNAVIQLAEALREVGGREIQRHVFERAGFRQFLDTPPRDMVDQRIPAMLFDALWQILPDETALAIAREAGHRTAQYILAHRIPRVAQTILKVLPSSLAGPLLLGAIQKNAWTFAGSGVCTTATGHPAVILIRSNPLAMPRCAWHQGVFECLFGTLVSPRTSLAHPQCCAAGHTHCRFELRY